MALTKTQVSELYVAIFGRASEGEGNKYWQTVDASAAEIADEMLTTTPAQEYFGETLNSPLEFIKHIYLNTLGRTYEDDAEGIDYWSGRLEAGESHGAIVVELISVLQNSENTGNAQDSFKNRVEVSNYTADTLFAVPADVDTALSFSAEGLNVNEDPATVEAANRKVDAIAQGEGEEPGEPEEPGVEGETIVLTDGRDMITGTENDDLFIADAGQNSLGMVMNALSTGDVINGGAGNDTLEVTLISDENFNTTMAPRPITNSVENVFVNALAQGDFGSNNSQDVTSITRLNADRMDGMEQLWSDGSEGSLRVENVGNPGDTEELTIGMRSTGNAGSIGNRDESNYEVYFKEAELTAGSAAEGAFFFNILNQVAYDVDVATPIAGFPLDSLRFDVSFDGAEAEQFRITLEDGEMDGIETHAQLVALLNNKLATMRADDARLADLQFVVQGTFNDGDGRNDVPQIRLIDSNATARELVGGSIRLDEDSPSGNLFWDRGQLERIETDDPVTATVILDDVGRQSDGGFLRVGSMSEGSTSSTGIEVYDLTVQRDSSLSGLFTTNGALEEILITSDAGFDGDLAIGNTRSGLNVTEFDLDLIQTNGFDGNLSLGAFGSTVKNLTTLDTVDMGAGQSTTFWGQIIGNDEDVYSYSTGQGNDFISLNVDTDAVDSIGTGLTINTNSGNDSVLLSSNNHASQLTQSLLNNKTVNTGAGDDYVSVADTIRTNINAGAGSDFVEFEGGNAGQWFIGQASGPQAFGARVLYQADLTLTFAGFESTVKIKTDASGLFIASQVDINNAVKAAIEANPELARLLTAVEVEGTQQLQIDSTVGGLNDLRIQIEQPTVVANNATSGQVNVPGSSELNALIQGLINTTALDSDDFTNGAADVVTEFGNLGYNGNVDANGGTTAADYRAFDDGGSLDAVGADINYSVIDMGTGSNDLLVLDSNDNSANVLKVSAAFGKVSVVNFHDISPNDVANVSEVGNHAIDFTTFLNNQVDPSATPSTESAVNIAVSLNTNAQLTGSAANSGTALANSVNMLNFDGTVANSVSFAALTAGDLVNALNNAPGAGVPVVGGIINTTLSAVANTTNLIGNVQKHIVMIENDQNPGEYKVFYLTSTVDTTTNTTNGEFDANGAQLLGTLDFGNSINFGLVGSGTWEAIVSDLLKKADGVAVDLTLAQAAAEYTAGNLDYVYNITDIATAFQGVAVADLPDATELLLINGAANSADYAYSLVDVKANLLGALEVAGAASVTATDALTAAEAATLYTANNNSTYEVVDTAANIVAAGQPEMDAATAVSLTAAETFTADVADAGTLVARLTDATGLTLDIVDDAAAIATAIAGSVDLSGANSIQHNDVDVASAATGTDTVADTFVFAAGADATITTFTDGEDVIDLAALTTGTLTFEALSSGVGYTQVEVTDNGGNAEAAFDVDDDGVADFTITLAGFAAADVDATDFVVA